MTNQISDRNNQTRPDDLMNKYNIKKDAYYGRLKFLGIQVMRDSNRRVYLTDDQVALMDELHLHICSTGKMEGFQSSKNSALATTDDNSLTTSPNNSTTLSQSSRTNEPNIYVTPSEPTAQFDMEQLIYEAAQLKARELAMQDLVKRALADGMNEEDLPEELKQKVNLAREAANPKFTPQEVAGSILTQWRQNRLAG